MLIVYDYLLVKYVEEVGVDMILVGDFLGMVVLGYDFMIFVMVDDMIYYIKVVKRGVVDIFIVIDMLFMFYYVLKEDMMRNVVCIMQESGVYVLKVEGVNDVFYIILELM